ncbi:MAG: Na(+)/H(+) antiporter subunit B, partial [Bacteroidales bacterium]|nr:Na(+)/H(+) antiporter subunit B [Bacteroidales bacterium]
MRTVILHTTVRLMMPLFFIFSVLLLFRGHNLPGGGFIGGLLAAIALFLHSVVFGVDATLKRYRLNPRIIIATGLLAALVSIFISMFMGLTLFTGVWSSFEPPLIGKL